MTSRKLIKYVVARERIDEVAKEAGWGKGVSLSSYHAELSDDKTHYAENRSGLQGVDGFSSCAVGCFYSVAGAFVGAAVGVNAIANEYDEGLIGIYLAKAAGAVLGFVGGGIATWVIHSARAGVRGKIIDNIIEERELRRGMRGIIGISRSQYRRANCGLVASESDRFDRMIRRK
jgi:hypothetical protein